MEGSEFVVGSDRLACFGRLDDGHAGGNGLGALYGVHRNGLVVQDGVGKDGKLFSLQKLDQLKAANIRAATTLQISGEGLLARVQIINSCGNRELDMAAGKILKSAGTAPGVYTINWNRNGGGR